MSLYNKSDMRLFVDDDELLKNKTTKIKKMGKDSTGLYNKSDMQLFADNVESLTNEATKIKLNKLSPTMADIKRMEQIAINFLIKKKRKIYGGTALNAILVNQNPRLAFYNDEVDVPDIDFYSPHPIPDLIELCNLFADAGFKPISGQEAQHQGTYKIFVDFMNIIDISYVPANIYNRIPFIEIKKIIYTHPSFMAIDYLRVITDPITSWFRFEKVFKRFNLLTDYFPFRTSDQMIKLPRLDSPVDADKEMIKNLLHKILYFLINHNSSCIISGFYYYNYCVELSKINKPYIKLIDIPYYDVITSQFREDGLALLEELKKISDKISVVEYYPFFQFMGQRAVIFYKDTPLIVLYHHFKRCIPYKSVVFKDFANNKDKDGKDSQIINLANFPQNLLLLHTLFMYYRTNEDSTMMNVYQTMIAHLIEMRNHYFKTHNKNIFADTIFQEFTLTCKGETIDPAREKFFRIAEKKKMKKGAYVFKYEPLVKRMTPDSVKYQFPNTSGNAVNNEKNLQLHHEINESDDEELIIEDDDEELDEKKK